MYRSSSGRHYLYYADWGSNQGANWVVSASYSGDTPVLASSPNLEHRGSVCVDTLDQVSTLCGYVYNRAANDPSVFTVTEKDPTRAISWLKVPTSAFTSHLRHY